MEILRNPYIRALVEENPSDVFLGPPDECTRFIEYTGDNYPWMPVTFDSIDWRKIPDSATIDISQIPDSEVEAFVRSTTVSKYEYVTVVYRESEGLTTSLNFFLRNFDSFIRPHIFFIVGAVKVAEGFELVLDDFLEWELDEGIFLSGKKLDVG